MTVSVTLETPVTYADKAYTTLTLRKMRVKDLVAGDLVKTETQKSIAIFASMAGVPMGVIEELDMDDFATLADKATPLMGKSIATALVAPAA